MSDLKIDPSKQDERIIINACDVCRVSCAVAEARQLE